MEKTYFICKSDLNGQRTGTYYPIQLSDSQVTVDRFGNIYYGGIFLYEDEFEAALACQN